MRNSPSHSAQFSKWKLEMASSNPGCNLLSDTATFLRMSAERLNRQMNSDLAMDDPTSKLDNAYKVLNQATTRAHTIRASTQGLRSSMGSARQFTTSRGTKSRLIDLPNFRHFDLKSEDFLTRKVQPRKLFNYSSKDRIKKQLEDLQRKRKINNMYAKTYRYRPSDASNTKMDLIEKRAPHQAQFTSTPAKVSSVRVKSRYMGTNSFEGSKNGAVIVNRKLFDLQQSNEHLLKVKMNLGMKIEAQAKQLKDIEPAQNIACINYLDLKTENNAVKIEEASRKSEHVSHTSKNRVELESKGERERPPTSPRVIIKELESRLRRSKSYSKISIPRDTEQLYSHRDRTNNPYQEDLRRKLEISNLKRLRRSSAAPRLSQNSMASKLIDGYHQKFPKMPLTSRVQEILKESEERRRQERIAQKNRKRRPNSANANPGPVSERSSLLYNLNYKPPSRETLTLHENSIASLRSIQSRVNAVRTMVNSYKLNKIKESQDMERGVRPFNDNSKLYQEVSKSSLMNYSTLANKENNQRLSNICRLLIKRNIQDCSLKREVSFICNFLIGRNIDLTRLNIWYDSMVGDSDCCLNNFGYFKAKSSYIIFNIVKEFIRIANEFSEFLVRQQENLKNVGKFGCNRPDSFRYYEYRDQLEKNLRGLFNISDVEFWLRNIGFKL